GEPGAVLRAAQPVLRTEDHEQAHAGSTAHEVDVALTQAVHPGLVREQRDALAGHEPDRIREQHLDPRPHLRGRGCGAHQPLQRRSRLPLLVSADLEWGAAMRVVGATAFPQIMAVGATGDARDAYTIGAAAATEGRAVGIHVNFAPDADVNNNPANPIINIRSFGEDPRTVSRFVTEYVRGLHDHGMLATLKHFPGHGDTQID